MEPIVAHDDFPLTITTPAIIVAFCLTLSTCGGVCAAGPHYTVYTQRLEGEAELARADANRQIAVREAAAKKESAVMLAEAEVARARGVAEANEIIGASLRENEAYLRYLWIQGLQDGSSEVIYVPTEANLPILEARNR